MNHNDCLDGTVEDRKTAASSSKVNEAHKLRLDQKVNPAPGTCLAQDQAGIAAIQYQHQQQMAAMQAASLFEMQNNHLFMQYPIQEPSSSASNMQLFYPAMAPPDTSVPVMIPSASDLIGMDPFFEVPDGYYEEPSLDTAAGKKVPQQQQNAQEPATVSSAFMPPPQDDVSRAVTPSTTSSQESSVATPLLHQACMLYAQTESVIASTLRLDPLSIRVRLPKKDKQAGGYTFPINIALRHRASLPVLQLLADAGPDVLVEKDGPESCCTLSCALYQKRRFDVITTLLHVNPDAIRISDRHSNYPLHVACASGSSLAVVKLLAATYPGAMTKRNFHGKTPLEIAQRTKLCSDAVIDFLQQTAYGSLEEEAQHLD